MNGSGNTKMGVVFQPDSYPWIEIAKELVWSHILVSHPSLLDTQLSAWPPESLERVRGKYVCQIYSAEDISTTPVHNCIFS